MHEPVHPTASGTFSSPPLPQHLRIMKECRWEMKLVLPLYYGRSHFAKCSTSTLEKGSPCMCLAVGRGACGGVLKALQDAPC